MPKGDSDCNTGDTYPVGAGAATRPGCEYTGENDCNTGDTYPTGGTNPGTAGAAWTTGAYPTGDADGVIGKVGDTYPVGGTNPGTAGAACITGDTDAYSGDANGEIDCTTGDTYPVGGDTKVGLATPTSSRGPSFRNLFIT